LNIKMKKIEQILSDAEKEGRYSLYESEVYDILNEIGIPSRQHEVIKYPLADKSQLEKIRTKYGDKVVMKISSPDVDHKTNIGAIKIVDNNLETIEKTYDQILRNTLQAMPDATINGILMNECINIDHEILLSMLYDDQFENFITVGMGGVMTEIFKDISIKLAPATKKEIGEAIKELKSYRIIQGYRGKPGVNEKNFVDTIYKLNKLAEHFSPYSDSDYLIKELEINPIASLGDELIPIDGLLKFERKEKKEKPKVSTEGIEAFFSPKTVAVIGATEDTRIDGNPKEGRIIFENLLKGRIKHVYPVNPKREVVLGKKCYPSIKDIPGNVDLAVVVVPAKATPGVMEDIKEKGTKNAVIIGGGFSELGKEGKVLEDKVRKTMREGNIRIIGPNCIGIYSGDTHLNTIFLTEAKYGGVPENIDNNVAIITQSGAVGINLMESLEHVGIRNFVSVGNMIDPKTDYASLLKYFEEKEDIAITGIYVEGFKDGRKFYDMAKKLKKPIVLIKGGKSQLGAKATSSHTGSMAGNYKVAKAAFKQANIIEAETSQDFFDTIKIFSYLNEKKVDGNKIAIVSNAGGLGVLSTDMASKLDIQLATYTNDTREKLVEYYEDYLKANVGDSPTDLGGGVNDRNFIKCLKIILEDKNVNGLVISPGIETQPMNEEPLIKNMIRLFWQTPKPIVVTLPNTQNHKKLIDLMEEANIPCYLSPEQGVKALDCFMSYSLKVKK